MTYIASWPEDGRPQHREFATESEALAFVGGRIKPGCGEAGVVYEVNDIEETA